MSSVARTLMPVILLLQVVRY